MSRRLSSNPAIVWASSAPPVTRPGHHFGRLDDGTRKHVDQILCEAPDCRWLSEQLVRVQVDAAVVAVAEIKVPVEHQHFVLLEIFEGFLANLVSSVHGSPKGSGVIQRRTLS